MKNKSLLYEKYKNTAIVLGSQSPRRRELLGGLELPFSAISLEADESYPSHLKEEQITEYLCRQKAKAFTEWSDEILLITADTIVVLDGIVLEKPNSSTEAKNMLQNLSGKTHQVISSVGLFTTQKEHVFSDITLVEFDTMNQDEIDFYVENYQPLDKAGAYGVQEWWGYVAVKKLTGSYFTVMGLPLHKLYKALKQF